MVDLSVGSPCDPPSPAVLAALASADEGGATRGYPSSAGSSVARTAAADWMGRRLGVSVDPGGLALCIGTKELVAGLPAWLHLRDPSRDTVLYPALSYPTYEMGALLGGLRAVPVPVDEHFRLRLTPDAVSDADAERALVLWVNSPGNPAGALDDLAAAAAWGRERGVLVASDECYAELTWNGPPRTVLGHGGGADGLDGVLAVHSLSKRSNLAGLRFGWYAGDPEVVRFLREVRQHAGFMVPGAAQRAGAAALADQAHADAQRETLPGALGPVEADPGRGRGGRAHARGRHLPLGARPRRGRVGPDRPAGAAGRGHRLAGRVLRAGRGGVREGGGRGPHGAPRARRRPARRLTAAWAGLASATCGTDMN